MQILASDCVQQCDDYFSSKDRSRKHHMQHQTVDRKKFMSVRSDVRNMYSFVEKQVKDKPLVNLC